MIHGPRHWEPDTHPLRSDSARIRQRSRIVLQYEPEEKQAIDWLSRCPDCIELPPLFAGLRGHASRVIAKSLRWPTEVNALVKLWRNAKSPPLQPRPLDPHPLETPE